MNALALILATAAVGVDYGWHRTAEGEWEYIIQIEPGLVETLVNGQALVSQMPAELRGVRRFRVQIGEGEIPRDPLPAGGIFPNFNADPGAVPLGDGRAGAGAGGFGAPGFGNRGFGATGLGASGNRGMGTSPQADWQELPNRDLNFLRQDPIQLNPLENSFLGDLPGPGGARGEFPLSPEPPAIAPTGLPRTPADLRLPDGRSAGANPGLPGRASEWPSSDRFRLGNDRSAPALPQRGPYDDRLASRTPGVRLGGPPTVSIPAAPRTTDTVEPDPPISANRSVPKAKLNDAKGATPDAIWWPLTTTVLLLFGSLGGNIYLGWLAMDFYRRYRDAAWQLRTGHG